MSNFIHEIALAVYYDGAASFLLLKRFHCVLLEHLATSHQNLYKHLTAANLLPKATILTMKLIATGLAAKAKLELLFTLGDSIGKNARQDRVLMECASSLEMEKFIDGASRFPLWFNENKSAIAESKDLQLQFRFGFPPLEVAALSNVMGLTLAAGTWFQFPKEIGSLANLRQLCCERGNFTYLPAEISQLNCLTYLNLNLGKLLSLPAEIGRLTNLRDLVLGNNQLKSIPDEIGCLTNLTYLDLHFNQMEDFSLALTHLPNLQYLLLQRNLIDSIPSEIQALTSLTHLNISSNNISWLPLSIATLNLNTLYCSGNSEDVDMWASVAFAHKS